MWRKDVLPNILGANNMVTEPSSKAPASQDVRKNSLRESEKKGNLSRILEVKGAGGRGYTLLKLVGILLSLSKDRTIQ